MNRFPSTLFAGKRFAVVGLARFGLPVARALRAMGAEVLAWDDNAAARELADATIGDPSLDGGRFDALILSPGIPHHLPRPHRIASWATARGIPILSDVELLYQAVRSAGSAARFVGITGTNGKSTTTALLAHTLSVAGISNAAGGNLGTPALALPLLDNAGIYVIEMSSYMLERIVTVRFDAAAMLNLSPDHLDRHGDMNGYAQAKCRVFDRQGAGDISVVGVDDAASVAIAATMRQKPARLVTVSGYQPADICCDNGVICDAEGPILAMAEAPALPGAHNAQNVAAASAMALHLGVDRATLAASISSFSGLAHRQQRVGRIDGVAFVNDSKATNADAAARALACYDRVVWIAGGEAKSGGIETLAEYFPRIVHAELIGRDATALAATLAAHGVPHRIAGTLENAVPAALQAARENSTSVVLLSPACASFDQFSGFDQRGDRFAALVQARSREEAA